MRDTVSIARKKKKEKVRKEFDMLFWSVIFTGLVADQLSKNLVLKYLREGNSVNFFRYFSLTCIKNKGICFGLLNTEKTVIFLIAVSALVLAGLIYYGLKKGRKLSSQTRVSLGMMSAGILGNLVDRIRFGAVVDFLNFHIWPVFNLADSLIVAGVGVFLIFQARGNYVPCFSENR